MIRTLIPVLWILLASLGFSSCKESEPGNPLGTLNMDWTVGGETRAYSFFIQPDVFDTTSWALSAISSSKEGSLWCGSRTLGIRLPHQIQAFQTGTYSLDTLGGSFTFSSCDSIFAVYTPVIGSSRGGNWIRVENASAKEVRLQFHLILRNIDRPGSQASAYPDSLLLEAGPITVPVTRVF